MDKTYATEWTCEEPEDPRKDAYEGIQAVHLEHLQVIHAR